MSDNKIKICAVDDDETILDIYESGLGAKGYDVTTYMDPKKAREDLIEARNLPDVILMDIMMPGLDGISLLRELRSNPKTSHIPIISVSGLNDAATLNDALLFGATDYVVKPFDIDTLDLKIRKARENSRKPD